MKWNFSPLFYSRKSKSMLYWFIIFEFKLWSKAQNNFSIPPKLAKMQLSFLRPVTSGVIRRVSFDASLWVSVFPTKLGLIGLSFWWFYSAAVLNSSTVPRRPKVGNFCHKAKSIVLNHVCWSKGFKSLPKQISLLFVCFSLFIYYGQMQLWGFPVHSLD